MKTDQHVQAHIGFQTQINANQPVQSALRLPSCQMSWGLALEADTPQDMAATISHVNWQSERAN